MSDKLDRLREADRPRSTTRSRRARRASARGWRAQIGDAQGGAPRLPPGARSADPAPHREGSQPRPARRTTARSVFREIMSACRALERADPRRLPRARGHVQRGGGAEAFRRAAPRRAGASIDEVFRARASRAPRTSRVVPVENSTEGAVGRTLDLLLATPLRVCGEVDAADPPEPDEQRREACDSVRKVYSHTQSPRAVPTAGSRSNLPRRRARRRSSSNAEAARRAARGAPARRRSPAEAAGSRYGLKILARNIEDEPNNTTRFLVLGRHRAPRRPAATRPRSCSRRATRPARCTSC